MWYACTSTSRVNKAIASAARSTGPHSVNSRPKLAGSGTRAGVGAWPSRSCQTNSVGFDGGTVAEGVAPVTIVGEAIEMPAGVTCGASAQRISDSPSTGRTG